MKSLKQHIKHQPILEGVSYNNDTFSFDFEHDGKTDIIKLTNSKLKKVSASTNADDVFTFAFEPEKTVSGAILSKFYKEIKNLNFSEASDKRDFVHKATQLLHDEINLFSFSTIVFPQSRTDLNREIVKFIARSNNVDYVTFEMMKALPQNIKFNFKKFEDEVLNVEVEKHGKNVKLYNKYDKLRTLKNIDEILAKLSELDYFSIAEIAKSKYKPYFYDFLNFEDKQTEETFKELTNGDILLVDDFSTTKTTIYEMIRKIRSIGVYNRIVVFTIIGTSDL
jgi:hypothetical protein